ncbi:MAG: hypothetical protein ACLR43_09565 [Faecalibacillus faecis]
MFLINGLFGDYGIQKPCLNKNIVQFEEEIKEHQPITTDYGTTNDNENTLSLVVKKLVIFVLK